MIIKIYDRVKYNSINFPCKYLTEKENKGKSTLIDLKGRGKKSVGKTKRLNIHS